MPRAVVLVNTDIGKETEVIDQLKVIPEVERAEVVYGVYDIVVNLSARDMDCLDEIISNRIRNLKGVRSTLTLVVSREYVGA